jgi:hypothetical protein
MKNAKKYLCLAALLLTSNSLLGMRKALLLGKNPQSTDRSSSLNTSVNTDAEDDPDLQWALAESQRLEDERLKQLQEQEKELQQALSASNSYFLTDVREDYNTNELQRAIAESTMLEEQRLKRLQEQEEKDLEAGMARSNLEQYESGPSPANRNENWSRYHLRPSTEEDVQGRLKAESPLVLLVAKLSEHTDTILKLLNSPTTHSSPSEEEVYKNAVRESKSILQKLSNAGFEIPFPTDSLYGLKDSGKNLNLPLAYVRTDRAYPFKALIKESLNNITKQLPTIGIESEFRGYLRPSSELEEQKQLRATALNSLVTSLDKRNLRLIDLINSGDPSRQNEDDFKKVLQQAQEKLNDIKKHGIQLSPTATQLYGLDPSNIRLDSLHNLLKNIQNNNATYIERIKNVMKEILAHINEKTGNAFSSGFSAESTPSLSAE